MSSEIDKYRGLKAGDEKLVNLLVEENHGWACSIAKSVARAWNLDWELDGLDGGAYEGLLFCARRYDPNLGVPFRAYARRRIHESSTEEARKSKLWKRGTTAADENNSEHSAKNVSAKLFDVFPSLRDGLLPVTEDSDETAEEATRNAVRILLSSASLLLTVTERDPQNPESRVEYMEVIGKLGELEAVQQKLIWEIYWQDKSMRSLAEEWAIDELVIIREHREIIQYIFASLSGPKLSSSKKPAVRRSLRPVAQLMKKQGLEAPFSRFTSVLVLFYNLIQSL